jgi:hypothetical protein
VRWRLHRRSQTHKSREPADSGECAVRCAEEIVSIAWINRLQLAAEDEPTARRLLNHERAVHLAAAARRGRAAATDD